MVNARLDCARSVSYLLATRFLVSNEGCFDAAFLFQTVEIEPKNPTNQPRSTTVWKISGDLPWNYVFVRSQIPFRHKLDYF